MMRPLITWCGVMWSVGELDHGMFRCEVVNTLGQVAPGWKVGDHCWLTAEEIHPSRKEPE